MSAGTFNYWSDHCICAIILSISIIQVTIMFKPVQQKKMYEYVIDQIYAQTQSGQLKKGDRLPPERVLTEQLGISRTSVREALRALEVLGIISTQQGEGNFINGDFAESLIRPMATLFIINGGTKKDAIDMRMNLECMSVKNAAECISLLELKELKNVLQAMKDSDDDDALLDLDATFHHIIAKATGNILLENQLQMVNYVTKVILQIDKNKLMMTPEFRMKIENSHHNLYTALEEHNPIKAEQVMKNHLNQEFHYALNSEKKTTESMTFSFD